MSDQHKNDSYGDISARSEEDAGVKPPVPAATVVLLRDAGADVEVLMLKKNSKIAFGGMWVFPGGKIDAGDFAGSDDVDLAARNAAARETMEEAGIVSRPDEFVHFAHWTPPPGPKTRFATWFFATSIAGHEEISIDDGEIKDHAWIRPADALERHAQGDIDLVPPTWVTLYHLSRYSPSAQLLGQLGSTEPRYYSTRVAKRVDGVRVAMWDRDAGYEAWDADLAGPRHRLVMSPDGFVFENDAVDY